MDLWLILITIICVWVSLHSFSRLFFRTKALPPGPPTIPFLGNFLWLLKSSNDFSSIEPLLGQLPAKYGPIITLYLGSRPSIFITTHEAAHRALIQTGSLFASRPSGLTTTGIFFSNQRTLSTARYGSLWLLLRKNFMSLFHPSRLHLYSHGRKWALTVLKKKIIADLESSCCDKGVVVVGHFQHAMFCLLVYMCFGDKFEEDAIREIETVQRAMLTNFIKFNVLNFFPRLSKIVFRKLWKQLLDIRKNQENVLLPLIKARREKRKCGDMNEAWYVDTLVDLGITENGRGFSDGELVSLCSEFINGGTDTSTTTLQWVMANLVKKQDIQKKLLKEIKSVAGGKEIEEEELKKMPYLKAVILETLRRHPPGHFILPRAVTHDTKLDGFDIPKSALVNFTIAEMAWDPKVWEDPMEFKPERFMFMGGEFDIKGIKEIKMMPFGAGRRVCPAISMAMLHLQYFVANLVRDFEWNEENNGFQEVDLAENQEFTMVMKNPLRVRITPRTNLH